MHSNYVVHLDIKPENILLTSDHHIVYIDFGFAKANQNDYSISRSAKGTPFYAAPELEYPHTGYDTYKSDVWSLGVTMYLLLERRRPFNLDKLQVKGEKVDVEDVWNMIDKEQLSFYNRNEYYKEYHYMLSRMLEKSPKHRWDMNRVKHENDRINKKYIHVRVHV